MLRRRADHEGRSPKPDLVNCLFATATWTRQRRSPWTWRVRAAGPSDLPAGTRRNAACPRERIQLPFCGAVGIGIDEVALTDWLSRDRMHRECSQARFEVPSLGEQEFNNPVSNRIGSHFIVSKLGHIASRLSFPRGAGNVATGKSALPTIGTPVCAPTVGSQAKSQSLILRDRQLLPTMRNVTTF